MRDLLQFAVVIACAERQLEHVVGGTGAEFDDGAVDNPIIELTHVDDGIGGHVEKNNIQEHRIGQAGRRGREESLRHLPLGRGVQYRACEWWHYGNKAQDGIDCIVAYVRVGEPECNGGRGVGYAGAVVGERQLVDQRRNSDGDTHIRLKRGRRWQQLEIDKGAFIDADGGECRTAVVCCQSITQRLILEACTHAR